MKKSHSPVLLFTALALQATACSSDGAPDSPASGGAIGMAGTGGTTPVSMSGAGNTSGSPATGGIASSVAGMSGASTGGAGSSALGGGGQGGAASGGATPGGGGGTGGSGGSSSATPPNPSAGCTKSPAADVATADHIYRIPSQGYDGKTPFPLLVGFHAAGNPIDQIQTLTKGSDFDKSYVRYYPKSAGSAWDYNTDMPKVISMYDDLIANYCVDLNRVFATGHSSGAQLITQLVTQNHKTDGQHFGFKAVAPVAADPYGAINGPLPVMYIQGKTDMVRMSDGSATVALFRTANGCSMTSMPYPNAPVCMSSGMTVNDGCIKYDGCTVPTIWCSHDDPSYSNTHHGWPCFATQAISEFFNGLP